MADYTPISCDVYDELILLIQRESEVEVLMKSGERLQTVLVDIFTKEKREYLKTSAGQILDFGEIAKVNDHRFDKVCFTHES